MTGVAAANSLFIDMVKNFNLIFIVLFGLLSCSEELVKIGSGAYVPDSQWKETRKALAYAVWEK